MVGKAPQPNAYEQEWQDKCRDMYPEHYGLHHCQKRKARFRKGLVNIKIGQLFINMLPDHLHTGPDGIHSDPDRRNGERLVFNQMCVKYREKHGDLYITDDEYQACMEYR